jgi:hypothetical protein
MIFIPGTSAEQNMNSNHWMEHVFVGLMLTLRCADHGDALVLIVPSEQQEYVVLLL